MIRKMPTDTAIRDAALRNLNTAIALSKAVSLRRGLEFADSRSRKGVWGAGFGLKDCTAMISLCGGCMERLDSFQASAKMERRKVSPNRGRISSRCAMRCACRNATRLAVSQIFVRSANVSLVVRIRSAIKAKVAVNLRASCVVNSENIGRKVFLFCRPKVH